MPFTFKLSKRLAQSWTTRAVLIIAPSLHFSIAITAALVGLSSLLSVRVFASAFRDRRYCPNRRLRPRRRRDPLSTLPRLSDQHPCRELFLPGFVMELCSLAIPKVAPSLEGAGSSRIFARMALKQWEPRSDGFDAAQICRNGHVITTIAGVAHEQGRLRPYCSQCGEETFVTCPKCHEAIKGAWPPSEDGLMEVPGFRGLAHYCPNCGAAYPWTEAKAAAAKELLGKLEGLSGEERVEVARDLADLMRDSARSEVAATRFKRVYLAAKGPAKAALEHMAKELFTSGVKALLGLP